MHAATALSTFRVVLVDVFGFFALPTLILAAVIGRFCLVAVDEHGDRLRCVMFFHMAMCRIAALVHRPCVM
jgi:hypothetical protein